MNLSQDDMHRIETALRYNKENGMDIVSNIFDYVIRKRDVNTLNPGEYVNDEVIN